MNKSLTLLVGCVTLISTGCTFPTSGPTVSARQANVMQSVDKGSVISVRSVTIKGRQTGLGVAGGGIVGNAAARPSVGNRSTAGALGQAGGTIVGAVVGSAVEEVVTRENGQEVVVRLDDGRTVIVTQSADEGKFRDGDRVRVINGGGGARIMMDAGS
jgi:outer membrane lipoprotein SlyB